MAADKTKDTGSYWGSKDDESNPISRRDKLRGDSKDTDLPVALDLKESSATSKDSTFPSLSSADEPDIVWFGQIDLNKKGMPSSDQPGYFFDRQLEELKHEITTIERGLDLDIYTGEDKIKMRTELRNRKERFDAIDSARPNLRGKDKDAVARVFKDLGERIKEQQPCYSDMWNGKANAQDEARKMVMPCIEIKSKIEADYCKQAGINIVDGKISRNNAARMAQLFGKVIGEGNVDMERFRNQK